MEKRILVTGCNGQLGSEIQALASTQAYPYQFFFTDYDTLDITDFNSLFEFCKKTQPQVIVNCAAYTAVDKSETEQEQAFALNQKAVDNLVEVCNQLNIYLVHISTDYVFDGTKNTPYVETDKVNPTGTYGKSKLAGEEVIFEKGTNASIIRTSWLYSSFGNNFVKTIRRHAAQKEQLTVVFDQIGTPTYAADLAKAILEATGTLPNGTHLFHFSNEGVCSWYDFAQEIVSLSGLKCAILPIESKDYPTPTQRPAFSVLNKTLFKTTFNQTIPYWRNGLIRCIKLLEAQKES